jgi:CHAD domain-containing protein
MGKRLRALVKDLDSARQGNVEALHRTRVASRRVREALPFIGQGLTTSDRRKVRRNARRMTRSLGAVRELDVALQLVSEIEGRKPGRGDAVAAIRDQIVVERRMRQALMLDALTSLRPNRLVHRVEAGVQALEEDADPDAWRRALAARIRQRAERLQRAIDHAGAIYLTDRLHAVRLALKKLRYALELAGEARLARGRFRSQVGILRGAQDTLGRLNDLEVVARFTQVVLTERTRDATLVGTLQEIAGEIEEECRQLHARFLAERGAIEAVCREAGAAGRLARAATPASAGLVER